ncbi:TetR/AcrR family transcriptional regulator C-terminal domain-containing protein [Nocardia huaxiensis]|uniref:TetR/AcrR family transcriptional regulator C-terminal domain-containing protein n=1 Tax=Nocardia huaxiensis TaxID=2755382 RepID=UPI001E420B61|nr:TetR/AcrR family transcriptional regulator C-terminal domain-containing protein [Nocardia huaxiensis]UFS97043.1 TetR/AcrR family transcriptional regulator C-terminal domain-containing protein [Nocardia huaxiensis]
MRAKSDPSHSPEAASIWLRQPRQGRREQALSVDRIVAAAVQILDTEGLPGLTMRALAQHLSAGAPTLYWHVRNKDDVIDLAVDQIFGEITVPDPAGKPWRDTAAVLAIAWRTVLVSHPWMPTAAIHRLNLGPNFSRQLELLQATLHRAGFTGSELMAATWLIYNHVIGSAASEAALTIDAHTRHAGLQLLRARADLYPTLAETGYLDDDNWQENFNTGLAYMLDGLQLQLDKTDM